MNLLFIFESIGTSELVLIGILALIFLGPRKLPELARKMGRIMADLRNTTNEFKSTWEREVNFEEETRAFRDLEADEPKTISREKAQLSAPAIASPVAPEVREIDAEVFREAAAETTPGTQNEQPQLFDKEEVTDDLNEKQNWL